MKKVTPSLPASSRMQMPMSSGNNTALKIKADNGGPTKKMHVASKGMKGTNPYC